MCHRQAHFEEMEKGEQVNLLYCSKELMNKPDLKYWKVGDFPTEQIAKA